MGPLATRPGHHVGPRTHGGRGALLLLLATSPLIDAQTHTFNDPETPMFRSTSRIASAFASLSRPSYLLLCLTFCVCGLLTCCISVKCSRPKLSRPPSRPRPIFAAGLLLLLLLMTVAPLASGAVVAQTPHETAAKAAWADVAPHDQALSELESTTRPAHHAGEHSRRLSGNYAQVSGTCTSAGHHNILTTGGCSAAAVALGLSLSSTYTTQVKSMQMPPFCSYKSNGYLYLDLSNWGVSAGSECGGSRSMPWNKVG